MNRQAGPSIVLSVLIVCFFAVVLFPGDTTRSTAAAPRTPIAGPIVVGQPTTKPAPPTDPPSRRIARTLPDSVAQTAAATQPAPIGPTGKVTPPIVVGAAESTRPSRAPVDSTPRRRAVPAMERTDSRAPRQESTARIVDPAGKAVRVASKGSIHPDPHTWSVVPPDGPAEKSNNAP
jgi:hypothetical protein